MKTILSKKCVFCDKTAEKFTHRTSLCIRCHNIRQKYYRQAVYMSRVIIHCEIELADIEKLEKLISIINDRRYGLRTQKMLDFVKIAQDEIKNFRTLKDEKE